MEMKRESVQKMGFFLAVLALVLGTAAGCSSAEGSTESIASTIQTEQVTTKESTKTQTTTNTTAEEKKEQEIIAATRTQIIQDLAAKDYAGTQTIEINNNVPLFTTTDLSVKDGAWESYGDLDTLNRATLADAMLNQSLMPTGKRGDISSVSPTGWQNKKIKDGYLYNRSHLIGWALSGENANWKNLITGTRQLNSPEMLRFEMDIKTYLEKSSDNYVRYRVTPIFRGNELLAHGVELEAQSISSDEIKFHVYIFNVQDGVTVNYADGSSVVSSEETEQSTQEQTTSQTTTQPAAASGETQYVDPATGQGLIKGSKNKIYHLPGSTYYDKTTNPEAWFKTVSEAQAAGYRAPKK